MKLHQLANMLKVVMVRMLIRHPAIIRMLWWMQKVMYIVNTLFLKGSMPE